MTRAYLICVWAYLVALGVGCGVGWLVLSWHPVVMILCADVAATVVIFGFSCAYGNSSFYDPYWSVAPVPIVLWFAWEAPHGGRAFLVCFLVFLWAVRLTANWARGWQGLHHEDWRYVMLKGNAPSRLARWGVDFFGIHLFPTLMVYICLLPVWAALSLSDAPLGLLDGLAVLLTLGAIALELVADEQLRGFRKNPQNQGKTLTTGLWRFSRHPNYLGECLFWWGLFIFCLAAAPSYGWLVFGPFAMTVMFLFVSIPLMEVHSRLRRSDYDAYARRTSALLLLPPRRS